MSANVLIGDHYRRPLPVPDLIGCRGGATCMHEPTFEQGSGHQYLSPPFLNPYQSVDRPRLCYFWRGHERGLIVNTIKPLGVTKKGAWSSRTVDACPANHGRLRFDICTVYCMPERDSNDRAGFQQSIDQPGERHEGFQLHHHDSCRPPSGASRPWIPGYATNERQAFVGVVDTSLEKELKACR